MVWCDDTYTSQTVENKDNNTGNRGMKPFEINVRAVYRMRTIGVDHSGLDKLCVMLNMPKPMTVKKINNNSNMLRDTAKVVTEKSMVVAANNFRKDADVIDNRVSVDGI